MLSEKLGLIENLFMLITSEGKEDNYTEDDRDLKIEIIDKDEELSKVGLEKDLNSTGKKKADFYRDVIDMINKTIEGTATVDDLINFIKKRKKKEKQKSFIKF